MNDQFFKALLEFGILFSQLSGKMLEQVRPEMLTHIQFEILQIVESSSRVTLSELCACTKLSMPNASREVRKLVEKDMLHKEEDPKDKRVAWIVLSPNGREVVSEAYEALKEVFALHYKQLSESEIIEMTQCLNYLKKKL